MAIHKELKMQGFMANSFYDRFEEAFKDLRTWIIEVSSLQPLSLKMMAFDE